MTKRLCFTAALFLGLMSYGIARADDCDVCAYELNERAGDRPVDAVPLCPDSVALFDAVWSDACDTSTPCSDNICVATIAPSYDCKVYLAGLASFNECINDPGPEPGPFSCVEVYGAELNTCTPAEEAQIPVFDDGDLVCDEPLIWVFCCPADDSYPIPVCE